MVIVNKYSEKKKRYRRVQIKYNMENKMNMYIVFDVSLKHLHDLMIDTNKRLMNA